MLIVHFYFPSKKKFKLKVIYNIRDARGVLFSFSKKVQTPKGSFGSLIYYNCVNLIAELVYFSLPREAKVKIKYEDLMQHPFATLKQIECFLNINLEEKSKKSFPKMKK